MISEENKKTNEEPVNTAEQQTAEENTEPVTSTGFVEAAAEPQPQSEPQPVPQPSVTIQAQSEPQHPFSREEWILTHLEGHDLLEYLKMENEKEKAALRAKETRQERILSAFQLTVSLAAAVGIIYVLSADPTILVNVLYIAGITGGLWLWKRNK